MKDVPVPPVFARLLDSPAQEVASVDLPLPLFARGKVRDIYDLGEHLLMVTTDRISAFDVVMDRPIPGKGIVLTGLSTFWFGLTRHIVPNHLVSVDPADFPAEVRDYREQLEGRAMLVKKARRVDVECVVRGYLAGSAWAEYQEHGTVAGEPFPPGLLESQKLPRPLFTPATKADTGHDENISVARMAEMVGAELTSRLQGLSIGLYTFAEEHARRRGIIVADTKFEFGLLDGQVILIDEVLTPDSSRFWPADGYQPGSPQPSFDKQYLRDYLVSVGWNKEPPPPPLPDQVVAMTAAKYREAFFRLIG